MLADTILIIFNAFTQGIVNILPNVSISSDLGTALTSANGYISALNTILPVTTIIAIIGLFLTIELTIIIIKTISWILRKIPTIS